MLSFCRSGLLGLTLVSGSIVGVQASSIQRMTHQEWVSDVSVERLQDKSVLTEYYGESASREHEGILFRVGFVPRFGCAPLITFHFGNQSGNQSSEPTDSPIIDAKSPANNATLNGADLSSLNVSIDGAALSFPALVDNDLSHMSVYMNTNLERRITTRLRVEIGNQMLVGLSNGNRISFKLNGSRDAISIANQNCRRHSPGQ